jgi:hypothetical protein
MIRALGGIWCPLRGIRCKEMGENIFLFTFLQESGKRKALNEGPWTFNKELLVMQDFDPTKALEEYEFNSIPIWVRVFKLPLGAMERSTGEQIGDEIGEFIEVEVGDDGRAVGEFLRIHVRLDISKPIMRGITLHVGENMLPKWCPFEYEFLPDFCFTCGIIGHCDRACSIKLGRGEKQQFGKWLKAATTRKMYEGGFQRHSEVRRGGGRASGSGFDWRNDGKQSRSDSDSWKKAVDVGKNVLAIEGNLSDRNKVLPEMLNPLKMPGPKCAEDVHVPEPGVDVNKRLDVVSEVISLDVVVDGGLGFSQVVEPQLDSSKRETVGEAQHGNSLKPVVHAPGGKGTTIGSEVFAETPVSQNGGKKELRKFKKFVGSGRGGKGSAVEGIAKVSVSSGVGLKRSVEGLGGLEEELGNKKGRVEENMGGVDGEGSSILKAGLSEQPCRDQ